MSMVYKDSIQQFVALDLAQQRPVQLLVARRTASCKLRNVSGSCYISSTERWQLQVDIHSYNTPLVLMTSPSLPGILSDASRIALAKALNALSTL
jgi:hypothetical protein